MCGAVIMPTLNGCSTMDTTPPVSWLYSLKFAPKPGIGTRSPPPGRTILRAGTPGTSMTAPVAILPNEEIQRFISIFRSMYQPGTMPAVRLAGHDCPQSHVVGGKALCRTRWRGNPTRFGAEEVVVEVR